MNTIIFVVEWLALSGEANVSSDTSQAASKVVLERYARPGLFETSRVSATATNKDKTEIFATPPA